MVLQQTQDRRGFYGVRNMNSAEKRKQQLQWLEVKDKLEVFASSKICVFYAGRIEAEESSEVPG